ncbi:DUF4126 domain-containing protein [Picosynechococcus sp. PCC 73109]|uniref:DUF4126 domain-containing protein n=1 Tax=Picosynechococcus sp. PCC 73109 TaxID=374982 RepID=UPI0007458E41|nr:DUF4126 domain-containing protein [Picosynechococcus sp. PCC 73109]AMA10785.1 hypothetical protein AWQ23_15210 [Picosynechococcus sp. PCC 73109]
MDIILALCIGVTLSAAAGFRIFIPPLILSGMAIFGDLSLGEDFVWLGTYPAFFAFGIATIVEILAYYIPVVDNLLDGIEIPLAIAVGTLLTSASLGQLTELEPLLQWTLAILAGGSTAGTIETFTAVTRGASTTATGGIANPVVSTVEALSAGVLSLLALFVPFLAIAIVVGVLGVALQRLFRVFTRKSRS